MSLFNLPRPPGNRPRIPQPAEDTGRPADDAAAPTPEQPVATNPDSEGAPVAAKSAGSSIPDGQAPEKKPTKRRSPARKTSASKASAASEAQAAPTERKKAASGTRQGATRRRTPGPRTRGDAKGPSASPADVAQSVAPSDASGSPPIDPMAELAGLAERSLHESLQSLRSVTESRSLSELLERQSRHMRLMSEIWVRQAQRSMEVFNAMLVQRRK
jgi:hypothetical protein